MGWVIPGLVRSGELVVVYGQGQSGKTRMAMSLARAAVCAGGLASYISDASYLKTMSQFASFFPDETRDRMMLWNTIPHDIDGLTIIDEWPHRALPHDVNDAAAVDHAVNEVRNCIGRDVALVLCCPSAKAGGGPRGSSVTIGLCSISICMQRMNGRPRSVWCARDDVLSHLPELLRAHRIGCA